VDFLRAKQTNGVALMFTLGETRQIDVLRRAISVRVSWLQRGTPANSEVRMQIQIEKDAQGRWCITRVTGDN
jgi:hypothetical protein